MPLGDQISIPPDPSTSLFIPHNPTHITYDPKLLPRHFDTLEQLASHSNS